MRHMLLAASLAMVCLAGQARADDIAETWRVTEGNNGATRGMWQVTLTGDQLTGSARMYLPSGAMITYGVSATVGGGLLVFNRVNPSDGALCQYVGQPGADGAINGTTMCNGTTNPWTVQVTSTSAVDGVPQAAASLSAEGDRDGEGNHGPHRHRGGDRHRDGDRDGDRDR